MPWKMQGDAIVVQDNNPIWINGQGGEIPVEDLDTLMNDIQETRNELARINAESKERRLKIRDLEERLEVFEGIDPEQAKSAIKSMAALKDKDKGIAEKLAEREKALTEAHRKVVDGLRTDIDRARNDIRDLTVRAGFASSRFLAEKTILPEDIAFTHFGHYFTVEDVDGKPTPVARIGKETIYSRDPNRAGKPAGVDEALSILIMEHYPNKERILAGSGASGSATPPGSGAVRSGTARIESAVFTYPSMEE